FGWRCGLRGRVLSFITLIVFFHPELPLKPVAVSGEDGDQNKNEWNSAKAYSCRNIFLFLEHFVLAGNDLARALIVSDLVCFPITLPSFPALIRIPQAHGLFELALRKEASAVMIRNIHACDCFSLVEKFLGVP